MARTHRPFDRISAPRPGRGRGFTLLELMVTLSVAAILLAIAVPSFRYLIISNRLTTAANDVISAVTLTRAEAIKRNARVDFGTDGSVKFTSGGVTTTIRDALVPPPKVTLAIPQALVGTPAGILQVTGASAGFSGLVADVSTTDLSTNNHRCVYLATGAAITSCTDSQACGGTTANASCKTN